MRTMTQWRQADFAYAENAAQNEKRLIKVEFRQEIGKINNLSRWWGEDRENPRDEPLVWTSLRLGQD